MNDTTKTTQPPAFPPAADEQYITLDMQLKIPVKNLTDVADKVKSIVAQLKPHGELEGHALFGRTKFQLT